MTFGEIKSHVSAYAEDRPDIAAKAGFLINAAKLKIQRKFDFFFMLKASPPLTASGGDVAMPTDFKRLAQSVVKVGEGHLPVINRRDWLNGQCSRGAYLFPVGGIVHMFIVPASDVVVEFDYFSFLPPYSADSDEDFLARYGYDYLIYAALREANYFLKDNEQIQIDAVSEQSAFAELVGFDTSLCASTEKSPRMND